MLALLLFVCLVGHQDQCRIVPVAAGFVSDDACKASKPLALGWLKIHEKELEIRKGTEPMCVTNPEWWLHRFAA